MKATISKQKKSITFSDHKNIKFIISKRTKRLARESILEPSIGPGQNK